MILEKGLRYNKIRLIITKSATISFGIGFVKERIMSEINRINGIDNKNVYGVQNKKTNSGNTSFSSYLGETKSLDEIFTEAAEKYNVPVELLKAVGKAESGFDAKAVSRCGAQGIMQLMPATAASLGVTDPFDPEQNIMGGAKYLAGLLNKYDGNASLALAAYNAGSGNVAKYGGIPPFKETQNYVKKVLSYMREGVDTENKSVAVGSANSGSNPVLEINIAQIKNNIINREEEDADTVNSDLEEVFTYEEYMEFIDTLFKEEEEEKSKKDYYMSNTLNINLPVLNLLKGQ